MTPARALSHNTPIPYYLLSGRRLKRDVKEGQMILCGDVDLDTGSELYRLRAAQDAVTDWS
jgi:predicted homoserine dehydrogenase-like protein